MYELGGLPVGVRSTSTALLEGLDTALGGRRATDDRVAAAWTSVVVGEPARSGPAHLHLVYRGCQIVARTRDVGVLARAVLGELEVAVAPERADRLYLDAAVLTATGADRGAIVSVDVAAVLASLGGRLRREGLVAPAVAGPLAVELTGGRLERPGSLVGAAPGAAERLASLLPGAGSDTGAGGGPPAITAVCWHSADDGRPVAAGSAAATVAAMLPAVLNLERIGRLPALRALARMVEARRGYAVDLSAPARTLPLLRAAIEDEWVAA